MSLSLSLFFCIYKQNRPEVAGRGQYYLNDAFADCYSQSDL